jgi:hypothetical protein
VELRCLIGAEEEIASLAAAPEGAFLEAVAEEEARRDAEPVAADSPEASPAPRPPRADADDSWTSRLKLFAGYDAQRQAVLCYVATLGLGAHPAAPLLYHDVARTAGVKVEAFELATLRLGADRIAARHPTGAVSYCLTPVSYETLADRRRRDAYLAASAQLPEEIRRYILPSVFGGPLGPSSSFLMEIVGALRQCYAIVDWQTRTCLVQLEPLKDANLFAVTLALPHGANQRRIELGRLPGFVSRLQRLRLRSGAMGLATAAEMEAAIAARAHFLSGPAVSTEMPELVPYVPLSVERLPLAS